MKIVVLAGGLSPERDVSLSSGVMACNALRRRGHQAILLDLYFGTDKLPANPEDAFKVEGELPPYPVPAVAPDLAAVRAQRSGTGFSETIGSGVIELCRAADITYIALHGDDGENGRIQALFDTLGIRYTGSGYLGCALAMNKEITKHLLNAAGVLTPRGMVLHHNGHENPDVLPLPCVVKPVSGGSSIGISIVHDRDALAKALEQSFLLENEVLVEKRIVGREIAAGVLDGKALPLIEITPRRGEYYDYAHKYQKGWADEVVPAPVDEQIAARIRAAAVAVVSALKLDVYARVDFLLTDDGDFYCLEANTLPGMTPTSLLPQEAAAVGIPYDELCDRIVRLSAEKYRS